MAKDKEIWKDVVGYEDLYEVSNFGNVRSLYRVRKNGVLTKREEPYYPHQHSCHSGHLAIWLYKNGASRKWLVHRLVAIAFLPNPDNLQFINHKDEKPYNNHVENLEWCTTAYNNSYGTVRCRMSNTLLNRSDLSMPILRVSSNGDIREYPSMQEAVRENHLPQSNIWKCCNGKRRTCGGYAWRYKETEISYKRDSFNKSKGITDELKMYVRKYFSYSAETGKIERSDRKNSCGSIDKDGYLILKIKGKQFKAHRIAWFLYYGVFPTFEIDHINHSRTDNRIENLREVTRKENVYNTIHQVNEDTGVIGVYLDKKTVGLKKRFTTRLHKKTYRFYNIEDAILFRKSNNLQI